MKARLMVLLTLLTVGVPVAGHGDEHIVWRVAIAECDGSACLTVVEGPTANVPGGEEVRLMIRNEANETHRFRVDPGDSFEGYHSEQEPIAQSPPIAPGEMEVITFAVPESGQLVVWCTMDGKPHASDVLTLTIQESEPTHDTDVPAPGPGILLALLGVAAIAARARRA